MMLSQLQSAAIFTIAVLPAATMSHRNYSVARNMDEQRQIADPESTYHVRERREIRWGNEEEKGDASTNLSPQIIKLVVTRC